MEKNIEQMGETRSASPQGGSKSDIDYKTERLAEVYENRIPPEEEEKDDKNKITLAE